MGVLGYDMENCTSYWVICAVNTYLVWDGREDLPLAAVVVAFLVYFFGGMLNLCDESVQIAVCLVDVLNALMVFTISKILDDLVLSLSLKIRRSGLDTNLIKFITNFGLDLNI